MQNADDFADASLYSTSILDLVTGTLSLGPRLPSVHSRGCAAIDKESGYVYVVEGVTERGNGELVASQQVYRVPGGLRELAEGMHFSTTVA